MSKAKDARLQEDIRNKREEFRSNANALLSQLIPGSPEYLEMSARIQQLVAISEDHARLRDAFLSGDGPEFVRQQQARIAGGGAATPLEARTQAAFEGLRKEAQPSPFESDVLNALTGQATTTPSGDIFRQAVTRAASPTIDDSVFTNALKLVEDRVNQEYAGRGLLGGGLRLEGLGRAGVEASIAEAKRQDDLRQQAFTNFGSIFDEGEMLRNRAIGVEDALVQMQLGRESNLTGLLSQNTNFRLNDIRDLLERQSGQGTADRLDAEEAEAARKAALGKSIGEITGTVLFGKDFGGPLGANLGNALGGGGSGGGGNAAALLASQRAPTPSGTTPSVPLSHAPQQELSFEDLLRDLQRPGTLRRAAGF